MFEKLKQTWEKWGFEILAVACLVFLVIYALFRIGKKGTWSTSFYVPTKRNAIEKDKFESTGEAVCRNVLEKMLGKPFPKARPDFLRNPVTGGYFNLELDCYNPELRLAVEYSGIQHYKYTPYFHKNKEAFMNQKYRDDMKRRICREYGINLIEVPYTVKVDRIPAFLFRQLQLLGYK